MLTGPTRLTGLSASQSDLLHCIGSSIGPAGCHVRHHCDSWTFERWPSHGACPVESVAAAVAATAMSLPAASSSAQLPHGPGSACCVQHSEAFHQPARAPMIHSLMGLKGNNFYSPLTANQAQSMETVLPVFGQWEASA